MSAQSDFRSVIDIVDPADSRLDDFRDLSRADRRPDVPGGKGLVIAEGVVVVRRMLASRYQPHALMGTDSRYQELAADVSPEVPYYRVAQDTMAHVVGFHLNRGVLAVADRSAPVGLDQLLADARTVVVLEAVNDHENIGSVFRNAAALGAEAVILVSGCADPLYRRSVRVSMGHVLLVDYAVAELSECLLALQRNGFLTVALTPRAATDVRSALGCTVKVAVLVGAEGPGLTDLALESADRQASIPMYAGTDSLNLATATAIALYEVSQRHGASGTR